MRRLLESRRLPSLGDADGFSIIEVLVAAVILVLGALATFMAFGVAIHNVQRGKETQVGISIAQKELEKIRSFSYDQIALSSTPVNSTETTKPNNRVSGLTFNLNRSGASNYATMVVASGGAVDPGPTSFTTGDVSGTVYRYVVWQKDAVYCATSSNSTKSACTTGQGFKRVVIAVVLNKPGNGTYQRPYYELQSDFVDPTPG